jgi:hypothetical protein
VVFMWPMSGEKKEHVPRSRYRVTHPIDPLPKIADIERMLVCLHKVPGLYELPDGISRGEIPYFEVSPDHWENIRFGLLPAERSDYRFALYALGEWKIATKDGKTIVVNSYYFENDACAFAINLDYEKLYVGGNGTAYIEAIKKAHHDYLQRSTP